MIINDRQTSSASVEPAASLRWSVLVICLTFGLLGVEFLFRRPIMKELVALRSNVSHVERDMQSLVGVQNQVWEANNLLSSLKAQYRQIEDGRLSIAALQQLNHEIETETAKLSKAFASLDQLLAIKNQLVKQAESNSQAQIQLDQMLELQGKVLANADSTQPAFVAVNGLIRLRDTAKVEVDSIDSAISSVRQLGDLKRDVIEKGEETQTAREQLSELISLKNDVYEEASNIPQARRSADELIALKSTIANEASSLPEARHAAEQMIAMKADITKSGDATGALNTTAQLLELRNTLSSTNTAPARQNLDELVQIQDKLNSQSQQVSSAVQTLELLTDLSDELKQQVDSIGSLRKSLMEIVLLESSIGRVAKVLEPLTQLSNLRRLSDAELREAARSVIDSRNSRMARRVTETTKEADDDTLKLNNIRLFPNDGPNEVIVPMPPQEDINQVIDSLKK